MTATFFQNLDAKNQALTDKFQQACREKYGATTRLTPHFLSEVVQCFRPMLLADPLETDADRLHREELLRRTARRLEQHPDFLLPSKPLFAKLWQATCRLSVDSGVGSGFFADIPGDYIVTCAHVVDGYEEVQVERFILPHVIEPFTATVVALDYSTDLAILRYDSSRLTTPAPERLEIGTSPQPGDDILVSGFPFGSNSIRFSRGMVSGYHTIDLHGAPFRGPVIDAASVNPGNSGGPICDESGRVVGIVAAGPKPSVIIEGDDWTAHKISNANAGIVFSIDPETVRLLCKITLETQQKIRREYNEYQPASFSLSRKRLARLQADTRGYYEYIKDASPIGVFSFDEDQNLFLGWSTSKNRAPLDNQGLELFLRRISRTGGSFMLRGNHVLLYRRKYRGFIVPIVLDLNDD